MDTGLTGKVVLITGANNPRGIGAGVAKTFASQGAKVFLTYYRLNPEEHGVSGAEARAATTPCRAFGLALSSRSAEEVVQAIRGAGSKAAVRHGSTR